MQYYDIEWKISRILMEYQWNMNGSEWGYNEIRPVLICNDLTSQGLPKWPSFSRRWCQVFVVFLQETSNIIK